MVHLTRRAAVRADVISSLLQDLPQLSDRSLAYRHFSTKIRDFSALGVTEVVMGAPESRTRRVKVCPLGLHSPAGPGAESKSAQVRAFAAPRRAYLSAGTIQLCLTSNFPTRTTRLSAVVHKRRRSDGLAVRPATFTGCAARSVCG